MSLPNQIHPFHVVGAGSQYQVARSLRFRSGNSAYLSRTFGTPTSAYKCTFSFWVKRSVIGASSKDFIISQGLNGPLAICFGSTTNIQGNFPSDCLLIGLFGNNTYWAATNALYRDPSAWYHVVVAVDTTQATASNRILIYVNGVNYTWYNSPYSAIPQNTVIQSNGTLWYIGTANSIYSDAYLSEFDFIDGQALTQIGRAHV